jgi:hypothetical protein
MEPYLLTQEDIDKLVALNKDMNGVAPGTEATSTEIEALGIQPTAPAVTPVTAPAAEPVAAPVATSVATPVATPAAAQDTSGAATLQQLLAAQAAPATPTDPYANLSKNQRQMLAFSALSDAGASLAGRKGGSFDAMMGRFNEQADMQRKATAAQAQRQMMQTLIAPGGGSIEDQIQMLTNAAIAYPDMAPGLALKIKELKEQLQQQERDTGRGRSAVSTLRDIDTIIDMVDQDPTMTTGIWGWATRGIPMTAAGKTQILVDSVVSSLALDSLKALKATGATMGALNQSELEILKTELARIDLATDPETVKTQLGKVKGHYRVIISDLYAGASEEDAAKITAFLGLEKRPSWAGGSAQPSGTQREGETLEEFKKRMGLG